MARPSINSPSMAELANMVKNRRKSTPPEAGVETSYSNDSPPQSPIFHHSQPVGNSDSNQKAQNSQNIDSIRRKYSAQNQTLAKNNSVMLSKITTMESKISELINENMAIRRQKSMKELEVKEKLDQKLRSIEDGLYDKFDEMFQMFRTFREREDLPINTRLEVFNDSKLERLRSEAPMDSLLCLKSPVLSPISKTERRRTIQKRDSAKIAKNAVEVISDIPKLSKKTFNVYEENLDEEKENEEDLFENNEIKNIDKEDKYEEDEKESDLIKDKSIEPSDEEIQRRRPRRNTKEVVYTVNLRKKMRRESEALLTAVGDEIAFYPRKNSRRESSISQENILETKPNVGKIKSNESTQQASRKPLGNVTKSLNTNKIQKSIESSDSQEDPAIFEFDNEEHPPRTYKRRKSSIQRRDPRRHSVL
ncbi:hypothetical protein CAAN1_02S04082 [[Candida] anglica]|uniref:Shugoshin N-terminal coiled-coil domain-containing protein n=1 Tax=[Candida] anglica TaxID=148631 RepID=A0ABP0EFZ8_9ASCO